MGILIFQLTADHHFDQALFGQFADRAFSNKLTVAEHRDVIANLKDLFHAMRDIDDAAALRFQFVDHPEQRQRFGIGQRIGRLIHDDHLRLKAQDFGDFDHLLIANRQIPHQLVAAEAQIKPFKQRISFGIHTRPLDTAKTADIFAAEKNILRHG